jgi:hypothetical protein
MGACVFSKLFFGYIYLSALLIGFALGYGIARHYQQDEKGEK